eukprot:m51a1_g9024 hypothetical protein (316) ;mRNA; f:207330-208750
MSKKLTNAFAGFLSDDFKQQKLKAQQPLFRPLPVIASLLSIGVVFVPIGVVLLVYSLRVSEHVVHYGGTSGQTPWCPHNASTCELTINVDREMKTPVYLYYQLENYYQNHRLYSKSRIQKQLEGSRMTSYKDLSDCDPRQSLNGSSNPEYWYIPCGLVAYSKFNDTVAMRTSSGEAVPLKKEGIAWKSDLDMFKTPPKSKGIWIQTDFKDEDFVVWMRGAALPKFRKLWRIIEKPDRLLGNYTFTVANNYPVSEFGKKALVLSEISWMGGRNPFLGIAYIVVGSLLIVVGLLFVIKQKTCPRKLGDTDFLPWNRK